MRKLLMLSLVALLVPAASRAQVSLGLRLGYAPAMGEAVNDGDMSDVVKSQIPVQVDAAYKLTKDVAVGAYFSYGIAQLGLEACDQRGVDCSASVIRFGIQGHYTFNEVQLPLVPWAGVGFGYEMGSLEAKRAADKATHDYSGFEFLNLQVGGDYKVNERLSVGPYAQLSLAQYSSAKIEDTVDPSRNVDGEVEDEGMHEWFGFGIRGRFDL